MRRKSTHLRVVTHYDHSACVRAQFPHDIQAPTTIEPPMMTRANLLTKGLVLRDKAFITENVVDDYIQHSPFASDGRAGLLAFVDALQSQKTAISIKPVRVLQDGDLVIIQSAYNLGGRKVVFDLLRFKDGKIVEHWDVIQEIPTNMPHNNGMF